MMLTRRCLDSPRDHPQALGVPHHTFAVLVAYSALPGSLRQTKCLYPSRLTRFFMETSKMSHVRTGSFFFIDWTCGKKVLSVRPAVSVQSVQRLATGWTVRGSNPGGGEIFRTRPDRLLGPTHPPVQWALGLSRGVKRSGSWR